MSPEYGATCGFFPVDDVTLAYLRLTGRSEERIELVEAYCKENLLWHDPAHEPTYTEVVELDLSEVVPSIAGPRRPQDRVALSDAKNSFLGALESFGIPYGDAHDEQVAETFPASDPTAEQHPAHNGVDETEAPVDVPETRRRGARQAGARDDERRPLRPRARRGRDRRDHELHEHLEPAGDDRRRPAREEGDRERA